MTHNEPTNGYIFSICGELLRQAYLCTDWHKALPPYAFISLEHPATKEVKTVRAVIDLLSVTDVQRGKLCLPGRCTHNEDTAREHSIPFTDKASCPYCNIDPDNPDRCNRCFESFGTRGNNSQQREKFYRFRVTHILTKSLTSHRRTANMTVLKMTSKNINLSILKPMSHWRPPLQSYQPLFHSNLQRSRRNSPKRLILILCTLLKSKDARQRKNLLPNPQWPERKPATNKNRITKTDNQSIPKGERIQPNQRTLQQQGFSIPLHALQFPHNLKTWISMTIFRNFGEYYSFYLESCPREIPGYLAKKTFNIYNL